MMWLLVVVVGIVLLMWVSTPFLHSLTRLACTLRFPSRPFTLLMASAGTSLPEIAMVIALIQLGRTDLIIPLAVGSIIAHLCLVVGVVCLKGSTTWRSPMLHGWFLSVIVLVIAAGFWSEDVHTIGGGILVIVYLLFVWRLSKGNLLPQLPRQLTRYDLHVYITPLLLGVGLYLGGYAAMSGALSVSFLTPTAFAVLFGMIAAAPDLIDLLKTKTTSISAGPLLNSALFTAIAFIALPAFFFSVPVQAPQQYILPLVGAGFLFMTCMRQEHTNRSTGWILIGAYALFLWLLVS